VLERIAYLEEPGIDRHMGNLDDVLVRRCARRTAPRPPSISARIEVQVPVRGFDRRLRGDEIGTRDIASGSRAGPR
jgi:hypothetical protein